MESSTIHSISLPIKLKKMFILFTLVIAFEPSGQAAISCQYLFNDGASINTQAEKLARDLVTKKRSLTWQDPAIEFDWNFLKPRGMLLESLRLEKSTVELAYRLNQKELDLILSSRQFRESLANSLNLQKATKSPVSATGLMKYARALLLARYLIEVEKPAAHYSQERFGELAKIEGLKPKTYSHAFRYDARSPNEVLEFGGFYPKFSTAGTILEHSHPYNSTGSSFVSLALNFGNRNNLLIGPVLRSSKKIQMTEAERNTFFKSLKTAYRIRWYGTISIETGVHKINEYSVESPYGVQPHKHSQIGAEQEIVTPFIEARQIKFYREILYVVEIAMGKEYEGEPDIVGRQVVAIEYGPWKAMPSSP